VKVEGRKKVFDVIFTSILKDSLYAICFCFLTYAFLKLYKMNSKINRI